MPAPSRRKFDIFSPKSYRFETPPVRLVRRDSAFFPSLSRTISRPYCPTPYVSIECPPGAYPTHIPLMFEVVPGPRGPPSSILNGPLTTSTTQHRIFEDFMKNRDPPLPSYISSRIQPIVSQRVSVDHTDRPKTVFPSVLSSRLISK